ncbi:MAG: RimJ/RimL family protein N-acetyltransferase [Spirosomataceae bacterium]|jgi:RimJ/RimL family protein N-acetyltransferase
MNNINLTTDRVRLRLLKISDLNAVHELHSFPETDRFNTLGIPKNLQETEPIISGWINEGQIENACNFVFTIELLDDGQFIGLFELKLSNKKHRKTEVWYKLHPDFWDKGYATEAVNSILNYGFKELNLYRIEAGCAVENVGSIKVLEKVGMTREGIGRQILPLASGWSDNYSYAILETEYGSY